VQFWTGDNNIDTTVLATVLHRYKYMILLPIGPIKKQFKREDTYCYVYSAERNTDFLITHVSLEYQI